METRLGMMEAIEMAKTLPDRPWLEHEDARLLAGWPRESLSVIGQALGRTRSSVVSRAGRLGLVPKPQPAVKLKRFAGKRESHARPAWTMAAAAGPPPVAAGARPALQPPVTRKGLLDLALCDCRWPFGDVRSAGFGFCGQPAGRPYGYCQQHQAMAT